MIEFQAWPKTPRLSAPRVSITEKIDGTNAAVIIKRVDHAELLFFTDPNAVYYNIGGRGYAVAAQSRKRLIRPGDDNYGFAAWVWDHAAALVELLGEGRHFGEWWGQGIQSRYNMDRKVFSLFNHHRWTKETLARSNPDDDWFGQARNIGMTVVPLLYTGAFSDIAVQDALNLLRENGSFASAEWGHQFDKPEGVVLYHADLNAGLKAFVENDDVPKGSLNSVWD